MQRRKLIPGEPAPWFSARCTSNEKFHFDSVAGRQVVLNFFGSARIPNSATVLNDFLKHRDCFDDLNACFFGVSIDPVDEQEARVRQVLPGYRFFWDFDLSISFLYGAVDMVDNERPYRRCSVILDERLRIVAVVPLTESSTSHAADVLLLLAGLPTPAAECPAAGQAPILVVPRIFEPDLCQRLIEFFDSNGGEDSGFMREVNGKTVLVSDPIFKRRRDQEITDEPLRNAAMYRIHDRLMPEIYKAYQFKATRIERHIVACYDSENGGHFSPHRDNTTKGTAHRQFAVSLNLNTGAYEGGKLRFPEFGRHTYEAPAGGAVVFSCSLLHEATPVTAGRRYAYLPFLYDDMSAKIREANLQFVGSDSVAKTES